MREAIEIPNFSSFSRNFRHEGCLSPGPGVVKVAGDERRTFLHGLLSANILTLAPGAARFGALLSPQGKIVADFIVTEAPAQDGGGFFLDVPRAVAKPLVDKLNLYKLRSRVMVEDLSEVSAFWRLGMEAARPNSASNMPIPVCRR